MMYSLPYKTKQFFFVLIKLSIVVGAFYFIYQKLANNDEIEFSVFVDFLTKKNVFSVKTVILLVFLSICNWFLEILKWKKLVSFIKKISFKNALEQSLGALTASLFTPNRIGEYGAKAIYYSSIYRKRIVLINLLSNILQMSVTVLLGVIGFSFFALENNIEINHYKLSRFLLIGITIFILAAFGLTKSNFNIKGFSLNKIKQFVIEYPKNKLALGFLLSLLRYALFSFQFYFLLSIFNVDISYFNAMKVITSMYLLASIIPSVFVFDVIIKGSVAVYLFSFIQVNELTILSIIIIMWLLNFVLPSFFGSYYVLNFNFPKNNDTL
ncbi:lysylphosphatidylglycerol synthase domain-containing protein [Flaviramulus sp. BrNp1-15]|uniref:lysylphosphatidylglycerol synthase domain-containing protein n=1 Tax=Flaviramulus sp. BrNp1-15 TaxID=2916754 RepID=UPI001EE7A2CE|nr:lysylphosphatidylglycerol synthase domain-containing protein [Flaviramulus sp. BrNp1-15]ULC60095.1 lysylphosphatidylglycerol synthase domain-containing protein [Flaviramulus sp. BrNp1-15]